MTTPPKEANELLTELLIQHGRTVTPYNGWLIVDNAPPLMTAKIGEDRPIKGGTMVQLDIEAFYNENLTMVESFAGIGRDTDDALGNGLANFAANSLHVFLGAFWDASDDQVSFDIWEIDGASWRVVIGNLGMRVSDGRPVAIPSDLFDWVQALVSSHTLSGPLHWLRLFYASSADSTTCEVLLDNETWPQAEAAISQLPWPSTDSYYSVRCFMTLQRIAQGNT